MISTVHLIKTFRECFPTSAGEIVMRAPGRINLIGGHTDYNEGFVLPVGIDLFAYIVACSRKDRGIHVYAAEFKEQFSFNLDDIERSSECPWSNYPRGIALYLRNAGYRLKGMNMLISSTIPMGAGLGSSAAIEMATAWAFRSVNRLSISRESAASLCQRVENEFVGVRCGIMDQYASGLARKDKALLIDCRSLKRNYIPFEMRNLRIVVCHSKVHRSLASTAYNQRRRECEAGLHQLQTYLPRIRSLRDVTPEQFRKHKNRLDPTIARRCRHVVSENSRVEKAVDLLSRGDMNGFGALMYQSHLSLRDDYEVSCPELDLLIEIARSIDGVIGARLTGAGFGGCTVNVVRTEAVSEFQERMYALYPGQSGLQPELYICQTAPGLRRVRYRQHLQRAK